MNPQTNNTNSFLGNVKQKNVLFDFLFNNDEKAILIIAPSGLGKTTFCESFLSQSSCFQIIRPYYEQFKSNKEFIDFIESSMNINDVMYTSKKNKVKKILFFDDIDILLTIDRFSMKYIANLITRLKQSVSERQNDVKVVITCNASDERKLSDIKTKVSPKLRIYLEPPDFNDCKSFVIDYVKNNRSNKIILDFEINRINSLIKVFKGNLRNILSHLCEIIDTGTGTDTDTVDEKIENHKLSTRYSNMNMLDLCLNILKNSKYGAIDLIVPISNDSNLISMILYDNIKNYIYRFHVINDQTQKRIYWYGMNFIMENYLVGSIVESNAYKNNTWDIFESMNFLKCASIRQLQQSLEHKDKDDDSRNSVVPIKYTNIPVRTAQHYCNKKRLIYYSINNDISIDNVLLMCEVTKESIFNTPTNIPKRGKNVFQTHDEFEIYNSYTKNICTSLRSNDVYDRRRIKR